MTSIDLAADDVARFLQENPEFFIEHSALFANMRVPHPHETRAISLGERQIMTLRARAKELEWQLSGLIQNATGNEKISKTLIDWCAHMLAEDHATRLPGHIVRGLERLFAVPGVALRVWGFPNMADSAFTSHVTDNIKTWASTLARPYCGPAKDLEVAAWVDNDAASLAVMALTPAPDSPPFGLLVLASDEADRFASDMGTDFLKTIQELASASLMRLLGPDQPQRA